MRLYLCFILVLTMFMSPVSAYDGMFAVLDQRYFDGNWSNISSNGTSTVEPITTGRMIGWVDIIGFENTTILNGTEYVNGTLVPVFNYDISPGTMRFNDNIDLLTSTVEINQNDTDVVVTVTAKLDWHHSTMRTGTSASGQTFHWIDKDYFTDTGTFVDSAPLPAKYTMPDPEIIEVVQYNNTINPHSIMMLPTLENVSRVIVRYNDSEIVRHLMYGVVENKTSGAEYVNLTGIEHWEITDGELCSHREDMIVISEAPLNMSLLSVHAVGPYETLEMTEFNITTVDCDPGNPFHPATIIVVGIPIIMLTATALIIRSVRF